MRLPLLISLPHAGLRVPEEVEPYCILTESQIIEDGDEGAAEIYDLADQAACFVTTDIARAVVDVNRAEDDRRADGVVKTHTCWSIPVYEPFPPDEVIDQLLARYHRPYHERLTACSAGDVTLGVDCHTMAAIGPPIGPGAGAERPAVCLSNADGTCPVDWLDSMARCFERAFGREIAINDPFRGGHIIRVHAAELPWIQLELSRASFFSNAEKRRRVLAALSEWCEMMA